MANVRRAIQPNEVHWVFCWRTSSGLYAAARAAMLSGDASEWALAAIHARGRVQGAIHIGAAASVVMGIAAGVAAPWTLQVRERVIDSQVNGSEIVYADLDGRVIGTLDADTFFDEAPLPSAPCLAAR